MALRRKVDLGLGSPWTWSVRVISSSERDRPLFIVYAVRIVQTYDFGWYR